MSTFKLPYKFNDYVITNKLGQGSFGEVYKGY